MINFPVDHGTSGHLLGVGAAAIVLGPRRRCWPWQLCWRFRRRCSATADLAPGEPICSAWALLRPGPPGPYAHGHAPQPFAPSNRRGRLALGGFASVLAAAGVCSLELAAAGKAALGDVLPAMLQAHLCVGLCEALLTAVLVAAIRTRSSLPLVPWNIRRSTTQRWLAGSAAVVLLVAPWASSAPDGLEPRGSSPWICRRSAGGWTAIAPDYVLPGIGSTPLAIGLAGLIGVAAVLAVSYVAGRTATCRLPKR